MNDLGTKIVIVIWLLCLIIFVSLRLIGFTTSVFERENEIALTLIHTKIEMIRYRM